jgi:hypothetical protein
MTKHKKQVIASTITTTMSASRHLLPRNKVIWLVAVCTFTSIFLARSTTGFAPILVGRPTSQSQLYEDTSANRNQQTSPSLQLENVFTDALFEKMASQIQDTLQIPLPDPVVSYCLTQALEAMTRDLSDNSKAKLQELLESEGTSSKYDDLSREQMDEFADKMAQELLSSSIKVVDIPILTLDQELEILQQLLRVVLKVLTTNSNERRVRFVNSRLDFGKDLLSSPEHRRKLAQTINEAVDIPLLNEGQEESVLYKAVNMCASTLEQVLPPSLIATLKGETVDGISQMKEYMIKTVNQKVNLIGFNEEQEEAMIRTMVEIVLDTYVDGTQAEFLVLSKEEQLALLQEKEVELKKEIELSQLRFAREQANLQAKLERIQERFLTTERANLQRPPL